MSSSIAQSTGELWSCKDLANMGKLYLLKQNSADSGSKVLIIMNMFLFTVP